MERGLLAAAILAPRQSVKVGERLEIVVIRTDPHRFCDVVTVQTISNCNVAKYVRMGPLVPRKNHVSNKVLKSVGLNILTKSLCSVGVEITSEAM